MNSKEALNRLKESAHASEELPASMMNRTVKLLLYCTKAKPYLLGSFGRESIEEYKDYWTFFTSDTLKCCYDKIINGKIVAEADCDMVEQFNCCCVTYRNKNNLGYEYFIDNGVYKVDWKKGINLVNKNDKYNNPDIYKDEGVVFERKDRYIDTMFKNEDFKNMCLTPQELLDYIGLGKDGYVIHLKNVKLFNEPKKLSEYFHPQNSCMNSFGWLVDAMEPIKKASQNMMYAYDKDGNLYILISIQSIYMCDIMNGKKTIEVRKSILNVLKELTENESKRLF